MPPSQRSSGLPSGRAQQVRMPGDLAALLRRIAGATDRHRLVREVSAHIGALLPVADRVSMALLEPCGQWLRVYKLLPTVPVPERLPRVRVDGTTVGRVARDGVSRAVSDLRDDPNITFGHAAHDRIRSTLTAPIRVAGAVVGCLNAGSRHPGTCGDGMLRHLEDVAQAVGPAFYAAERALLERERQTRQADDGEHALVGVSAPFEDLVKLAKRAARSDADVLITGETGVGKSVLARAIHEWSGRASGPFVTVHLSDLSPSLVESELFGHEEGAFTGAVRGRRGRLASANGGTLFLDEIGETPLPIQTKLLRVLQNRCFERVGGDETHRSDVRVVAATSRDLGLQVRAGSFREDLYYRLHVVPLHVPSLRERPEDLEPLIDCFLAADGRSLSEAAWHRVRSHSWPGNVRELQSVLRRASILEDGDELELLGLVDESPSDAPVEGWLTAEEHQRRYIAAALRHCDGVIEGERGAARLLGLKPSTLRSRIRRFGIDPHAARRAPGAGK